VIYIFYIYIYIFLAFLFGFLIFSRSPVVLRQLSTKHRNNKLHKTAATGNV
jgi:hypothetical protein